MKNLNGIKPPGFKKLKLYGFNNLTKTLSFNIYDICYALDEESRKSYIEYIDEEYNSKVLTQILKQVAEIIGANILNISSQDYDPQGASVTMLVAEDNFDHETIEYKEEEKPGPAEVDVSSETKGRKYAVAHLDKSHITVHTYPESHPEKGISSFRTDIDVSTCGEISPLQALNFLLHSFDADIVNVDYRVRGFTRDMQGRKHFIDHKINSIQNFIDGNMRSMYHMFDVNVYQENIFHTKMMLKEFDLDHYLFGTAKKNLKSLEKKKIKQRLKKEMNEIFYGRNIVSV